MLQGAAPKVSPHHLGSARAGQIRQDTCRLQWPCRVCRALWAQPLISLVSGQHISVAESVKFTGRPAWASAHLMIWILSHTEAYHLPIFSSDGPVRCTVLVQHALLQRSYCVDVLYHCYMSAVAQVMAFRCNCELI